MGGDTESRLAALQPQALPLAQQSSQILMLFFSFCFFLLLSPSGVGY